MATRIAAVVVLVLATAAPAVGASAQDATIVITDQLAPRELSVPVGASVTWVNDDDERHRVRSRDGATQFDSGNLEPGERFTLVFETPGEHPYVDERNPDDPAYHGTVTVTSSDPGSSTPADGGGLGGSGTPADTPPDGPSETTVSILDRSFSPRDITVAPGTTVTWANRSDREHTVTFQGGGGSGELGGGATFTRTFDTSGTFDYLCALHPEMTGTVTVTGGGASAAQPTSSNSDGSRTDTDARNAASTTSGRSSGTTAGPRAVRIVDLAFEPQRLTVTPGSTVTWDNAGVAPHTVTSDAFDSGTIRSGGRFSRRFDDLGTYRYRCTLHPQMTGEVLVQAAGTDVTDASAPAVSGSDPASDAPVGNTEAASPSPAAEGGSPTASSSTPTTSNRSPGGIVGLAVSFTLGLATGIAGTRLRR